jgi:hypothetical protein
MPKSRISNNLDIRIGHDSVPPDAIEIIPVTHRIKTLNRLQESR